jgi:GNAT superfamily N-acetyltransferase
MSAVETPKVRLRLANAADAEAIVAVTNEAFAMETFLSGTRTDPERFAELLRSGEFLIAELRESRPARLVASIYIELRGERGYFGMLAVDPSCQGRGLGRFMVEAAEDYCRRHGCRYLDLTVLSLRPELPPFYRKLGYAESGTEPFRPSRPLRPGIECHCIVMSKGL